MHNIYDPPRTPRRRPVNDRFVPHREGVNFGATFSAATSARSPERASYATQKDPTDVKAMEALEARSVYENVLKMEMFGSDVPLRSSNSSNSLLFGEQPLAAAGSGGPGGTSSSALGGGISSATLGGGGSASSHALNSGISTFPARGGGYDDGFGPSGLSPSHSLNSLRSSHSNSSLSLPPSPRKHVVSPSASSQNLLRYSPKKLLRSESDLSDISLGGGLVGASGLGLNTNLRPESRDYLLQPKPRKRQFKQTPVKTLDAPGLTKNFYLNVLEWGPGTKIAVALHNFVYVWDHETSQTYEVAKLGSDVATSVAWMNSNEHLAVGTASGKVQIYDVVTGQRLRNMDGHSRRAGSLSWNDYILSSGSQDATILHRDCRIKEHYIERLEGHYGEVCGLKWNNDLQQLASGGNDNKLKIWSGVNSSTSGEALYEFDEHTSAVKGLAWSPHQRGLLASGGGFCDQSIWFWNTTNGKALSSVNTGSQVCNLAWNPQVKELVSTHGNAYNDIVVWNYPTMKPLTRLRAHGSRALHLSMSPGGDTLVTGAGDETLRLWSMFDDEKTERRDSFLSSYGQLR